MSVLKFNDGVHVVLDDDYVVASGSAVVIASDTTMVTAYGNAVVVASGTAVIRASGAATILASDRATVISMQWHSPAAVVNLTGAATHIDHRTGERR